VVSKTLQRLKHSWGGGYNITKVKIFLGWWVKHCKGKNIPVVVGKTLQM